MKYLIATLFIVCLVVLAGCLLTDRYTVMEPAIDPATGEQLTDPDTGEPVYREVSLPPPLDDGINAAAGGLATGGWPGALIAGVPVLAAALWQAWRARQNRIAAQEAAHLARDLRPLAQAAAPEATRLLLKRAGDRQDAAGVRGRLRRLRPADPPESSVPDDSTLASRLSTWHGQGIPLDPSPPALPDHPESPDQIDSKDQHHG